MTLTASCSHQPQTPPHHITILSTPKHTPYITQNTPHHTTEHLTPSHTTHRSTELRSENITHHSTELRLENITLNNKDHLISFTYCEEMDQLTKNKPSSHPLDATNDLQKCFSYFSTSEKKFFLIQ